VIAQRRISKASVAISLTVLVLIVGLGRVITQLGPWYQSLKMPSWQPPGPVFGLIWTTIYLLMTVSAILAWRDRGTPRNGRILIALFGINCATNLLWSLLFFKLQRPDWALFEIGFFWLSILALIVFIWGRNKIASALLFPYLVWVTIAAALNLAVVQLNGPFG
jgi:translocator protein